MRLAHAHFHGPISYTRSLALQNALLERHFRHKDLLRGRATKLEDDDETPGIARHHSSRPPSSEEEKPTDGGSIPPMSSSPECGSTISPPDPTLITFSTTPTYTVGRRHLQTNPISEDQQAFLSASGAATFHASPRGGLLTYHAPGQLTGYVVGDLRRLGITPRCWVRLLENSVMRTCAPFGVGNTTRTDDPGVWIKGSDRKICAIGVQVSKGVTSHGVGLNVFDHAIPVEAREKYKFTREQQASPSSDSATRGYLSWGFSRIVACGLEGKSVTWLTREQSETSPLSRFDDDGVGLPDLMSSVGDVFAKEIAKSINEMSMPGKEKIQGVYRLDELAT
ncbi:uncharacterized protein A1O9_07380 [Exophiala aquamarina CBS 119918]|uniref:Octanoyltransferase n=1 Tax=Exophiala aquamarina CBS 119918 TaxID=1182545 RepID=A0A072PNV2_9EURO|nr:uncharacterized protein A1O9_07380 [Exophiala aquamarina CBS 119918]KEF57190.1 hypothetical protein A1O9_07380 [Exophiala aquamarina CBS 119918]